MLKKLSALPIDTFLLAMAATVALAALFPARGAFAGVMSVAAKVVIALLFWLYGARLSPRGGLAGLADRARTVDGRLIISSPPGGPTVVTVELPSHA